MQYLNIENAPVFIFAGNWHEMENVFLKANEGLPRRLGHFLHMEKVNYFRQTLTRSISHLDEKKSTSVSNQNSEKNERG
jgi:hypothetical protein